MSIEQIRTNERVESWDWTTDTPYDIVRYAQIFEDEGADSQRLAHIASFIDYVNGSMPSVYNVVTPLETAYYDAKNRVANEGTIIYRLGDDGKYERHASIVMEADFIGDKIEFIDGNIVVVNTRLGYGVTPSQAVRFVNLDLSETSNNLSAATLIRETKKMAMKFDSLTPGTRYVDSPLIG